jgi:hypothetical protein
VSSVDVLDSPFGAASRFHGQQPARTLGVRCPNENGYTAHPQTRSEPAAIIGPDDGFNASSGKCAQRDIGFELVHAGANYNEIRFHGSHSVSWSA